MRFHDRRDAGRRLARLLDAYRKDRPLVIGLPRGGVPVAAEVASHLSAELDVWIVRKVGAPGQEEFGIGAVAEGGTVHVDQRSARLVGADEATLAAAVRSKQKEVAERVRLFRGERPAPTVQGRTVIVVDDGIATGGTLRAVLMDLRALAPAHLVVAVPVADASVAQAFRAIADEVIVVRETSSLGAVGNWYEDFSPTQDEEVLALLDLAHPAADAAEAVEDLEVRVELKDADLQGTLTIPAGATALVMFAHGSGSSRRSPRNRRVAAELNRRGLGTFLFDLMTSDEELRDARGGELRFDIDFLAGRLVATTDWLRRRPEAHRLAIGYFGASTGAAAALVAAADLPSVICAVVSRGGRPDLAGDRLADVRAPTLLIVGGDDDVVLELNRQALARLQGRKELMVVPGATHLFEEPGALEKVAQLAGDWFEAHLIGC